MLFGPKIFPGRNPADVLYFDIDLLRELAEERMALMGLTPAGAGFVFRKQGLVRSTTDTYRARIAPRAQQRDSPPDSIGGVDALPPDNKLEASLTYK